LTDPIPTSVDLSGVERGGFPLESADLVQVFRKLFHIELWVWKSARSSVIVSRHFQ